MVRKGWTKMDVPDGWAQIVRGPRPRSVQWPSASRQVPMRSQGAISKPREEAPKQPTPKGNPVESKIGRIEAALKVLGQEHSDARSCLEDVLKKAKAEGVSRDVSSRPPDVSVAEANAKVVRLEGSLAALGPHDVEERRVLEEALSKVRVRATVAPVGQRLDECEKYCERAAKRSEKAQEVVTEALKAQTLRGGVGGGKAPFGGVMSRSSRSTRTREPMLPSDRRVGSFAEAGCADGRRVEAESPGSFREERGGEHFETTSRTLDARGRSVEGSCAASRWDRSSRNGIGHRRPLGQGQPGWRKPTRNVSASPMLEVHHQRCEQVVQGSVCQIRIQRRQVGRGPQSRSPEAFLTGTTQSSRKCTFSVHQQV